MANAFDRSEYPTVEPSVLYAGDRWLWKRTDLTHYDTSLFALSYVCVRHGDTGDTFTITATEVSSDYVVEVASTTTTAYVPGMYAWTAYMTRSSDSERRSIGAGTFSVLPNRATQVTDPRTYAQQQIDRLQASYARLAAQDLQQYNVAERSAVRKRMDDVRRELNHWSHVRAGELNRERMRRGLKSATTIQARF